MKNLWKSVLRFGLIGMGCGVSAVAQAASGAGPYYAVPSWDQKLVCSTLVNCPRFIVLTDWNNEAVLDRETGLVWQPRPSDFQVLWSDATSFCIQATDGGRMGWRLPTVQELLSLLDPATANGVNGPSLPPGAPFPLPGFFGRSFWSATQVGDVSSIASKYVVFVAGSVQIVGAQSPSSSTNHFWCVRTSHGENPQ
jgi:hypothetical protein